MTSDVRTSYHRRDLLNAASAAAEQAPQLGDEIRSLSRTLSARSGDVLQAGDIDVRTLLALIGQTSVPQPVPHAG
jgi:hypothetical protein